MGGDLTRIQVRHWGLVAVAAVASFLAGRPGAGGVLAGGALIGLSLALYVALFDLVVRGGRRRLANGLLFAKVAAFLGLGWFVVASGSGRPDPLGFALGVTCCPAAIVWEAVRGGKA
jgi:hypothetical protein